MPLGVFSRTTPWVVMRPGGTQGLREQRAASIPDGRYALPGEVANLMLYLVSELASHITGQGMQINGGSNA